MGLVQSELGQSFKDKVWRGRATQLVYHEQPGSQTKIEGRDLPSPQWEEGTDLYFPWPDKLN
jgi:hypothetical protein